MDRRCLKAVGGMARQVAPVTVPYPHSVGSGPGGTDCAAGRRQSVCRSGIAGCGTEVRRAGAGMVAVARRVGSPQQREET